MVSPRPTIGVSACLLGYPVRYDGRSKRHDFICEILARRFKLIPICPEADAELGVPRPPVQLVGDPRWPRMLGVDDKALDVTEAIEAFSSTVTADLNRFSGFILKARSPSCGQRKVPLYDIDGHDAGYASGVFVRLLREADPLMPLADESDIDDSEYCAEFLGRVDAYHQRILTVP